jgi:hypothetical protein
MQKCDWGAGSPSAASSRSEVTTDAGVPEPGYQAEVLVNVKAVGNCHDGTWYVTEQVASSVTGKVSSTPRLVFPGVNDGVEGGLTVVGFVSVQPGSLPAVLVSTGAWNWGSAYYLVTNHDSRLAVVNAAGLPEGFRVGGQGPFGSGFTCGLTARGDLSIVQYGLHYVAGGRETRVRVTATSYVFAPPATLQMTGSSSFWADGSADFRVEYC